MNGWTSPQLGIVFDLSGDELVLKMPDGKPFETYQELMERAKVAEEAAQVSTERAAAAERALEEERSRSEKLAEQLKALGVEPGA